MDGTTKAVGQAIYNSHSLQTLNFRLFSIKATELSDPARVRDHITHAIASIESGTFDAMFSRAALLSPQPGEDRLNTAVTLRDQASSLRTA